MKKENVLGEREGTENFHRGMIFSKRKFKNGVSVTSLFQSTVPLKFPNVGVYNVKMITAKHLKLDTYNLICMLIQLKDLICNNLICKFEFSQILKSLEGVSIIVSVKICNCVCMNTTNEKAKIRWMRFSMWSDFISVFIKLVIPRYLWNF